MKPEKKLVKDLNDKTGPHSIRVKVINKTNTQNSPTNKSLNYQRITFQDEEGSKIKTTLYNDEIKAYEDIIQNQMEYEISNAKIRPMPEKYRTNPDDHPYQLSFGGNTIINPVEDVIGILIYVESLRQIPRPIGEAVDVREMVIVDPSTKQPLIITAWAELATKEGEQLKELFESFPVTGFTCLKPSYHKGFSLSTTSLTFVKFNLEGEKAKMLRAWCLISVFQKQRLQPKPTYINRYSYCKLLLHMQASDTLQEERHWLHVLTPEFDRKDVRFYLGCNHCGTKSNKDISAVYNCDTCKRQGVTLMNVTFEDVDETGSYTFTAFTVDAEKLLEIKANVLYAMKPEDYLRDAESKIRASSVYIQVGPAASLSRNRVLKWVLKQLSLD
ncbi:hypothetical protein RND81_01G111700 [Saponaria officinalis]|uniref:Uncharacterized protein n=1 Tax=Saponaria officinalis TaxID=3572 RepID=A0AAW1NER4_SAPOF